ncbi:unnamed protein product [Arabis nemorensis]|uniref:Lon proteolytic domain-containing protein n=1 Tax=Arabis nemorensis TaxID=586526 RepID=A0A565CMW9_9BRAS|nr:unnamed protein product [Arabis nemorensis]
MSLMWMVKQTEIYYLFFAAEKFKERIEPNKEKIPAHVLQVELTKLQLLEASSSEFNVTVLPWGNYSVGTANPLVLIDEIDKLGRGHAGDPASALLELMDQYLDVTIDLSKVLFVCTANVIDMILNLLLDRMEVISIAGYITDEKVHIARDYLEKTTRRDCGIKPEHVEVNDAALLFLIENYCREAGIALKLVREVVTEEPVGAIDAEEAEIVTKLDVEPPENHIVQENPVPSAEESKEEAQIEPSRLCGKTKPTVVEDGEGKGGLNITGQLGDVMKESTQIAHRATHKDGPSAGCTLITSLLSLAMKKPVRKDLALTGEVTLTGRILPNGGVKEKTIAARRSQEKTIIFPEANRRNFDELAENVKEGLDVHFVDNYEKIFELAFGYDDHQIQTKQED